MTDQAASVGGELAQLITSRVRDIPDYPQPGVVFKDITPLQGGLLILVDGKIAGAIGVSGALSAQDDQIAKAGADVLAKGM